jgi:hypothetical protein
MKIQENKRNAGKRWNADDAEIKITQMNTEKISDNQCLKIRFVSVQNTMERG